MSKQQTNSKTSSKKTRESTVNNSRQHIVFLSYIYLSYQIREEGKKSLPKWLSFDQDKNLLYGVPSWRDKGTYHLELHTTKTKPFIVYVKDVHDVASDIKLRNSNLTKIPSFKEIVCHSGLPVAAATIIFDLHAGKLGGKERAALLQRVAAFADIDVSNLHMSLGKGHSTALNLKDVMMLTAGPGNVHEAKEPGVVISWQIGCGIDVAGMGWFNTVKERPKKFILSNF